MCVFVLRPLLLLYKWRRRWASSCEYKTNQAEFTDWMSFLLVNLMEEISPNTKELSANTKAFDQHGNTEKKMI